MIYETKGTYLKNGVTEKFAKTISAQNEKMAREKIYAELGSKQKIRRLNISIAEVKAGK